MGVITTPRAALHNRTRYDCSRCSAAGGPGGGKFYVCAVGIPRSCALHGNEKHSHAKSKLKNVHHEHARESFPAECPGSLQFAETCMRKAANRRGKREKVGTSVREDFRSGTSKFYFAPGLTKTSKLARPACPALSQYLGNGPFRKYLLVVVIVAALGRTDPAGTIRIALIGGIFISISLSEK